MRIDKFFDKQPEPKFIHWINRPLHENPPDDFARTTIGAGEVFVKGAFIADCEPQWKETILTATEDFEKFLCVCNCLGKAYPIKICRTIGFSEESYKISITARECTILASDCEGARRAVYYLEEELIKREGPFLPIGDIVRTAHIKRRITRGFFSPTNRAPKWGDELLDDIDYYPENYLNRLAHNGTNGLWIYASFAQLTNSPYMPSKDGNCAKRMEKLSRVVEKCKKYGIKVYLFAIEPMGLLEEDCQTYKDMLGAELNEILSFNRRPLCPRIDKTREHVIYCLEHIFRQIPDLAGFISITAGERPTTCPSVGTFHTCPRCGKFSRGENLAYSVDMIKEGLRRAGTGAEFISWTYGHRYWEDCDIADYIMHVPDDVIVMENFEDRGTDEQLGKTRIAWDYWLSYPGPSDMFALAAHTAQKRSIPMYAKMQVCSSHEIATVPYIPVPGILFDKYKEALTLGVTGIMECWYFGNYPSLMNRASTELSYLDDYSDKDAFLTELAARLYGESRSKAMTAAWKAFEEGYRNYPTNIMFSYYGPMHDGIAWDLFPIPVNRALPRSWLLLDPPNGDRIGECLFCGHTLDEAIILSKRMCEAWEKGLALLPLPSNAELMTCATSLKLLFRSGRNILRFYQLREQLGTESCDPWAAVSEMEQIVSAEIEHSKAMTHVCNTDPRVGYHSEAEGFKFFPEKLEARINNLEMLFDTDFKEIRSRLLDGRHPIGYYYAEGKDHYPLGNDRKAFHWEKLDAHRAFGAYVDGDQLMIPIQSPAEDEFSICLEFALFRPESQVAYAPKDVGTVHIDATLSYKAGLRLGRNVLSHQSVYGESINEELSKYHLATKLENGFATHLFSAKIPKEKWNGKTAIKLSIKVGEVPWKTDHDPVRTLGKTETSPEDFGFLLPVSM